MDSRELRYFLPFVVGVFLFIFSVPPGNFPLNDDIIYFESVQNFLENGSLINNQPYIASLFLQIFYGAFFASFLGLSHAVLVLSMMFAGGIAVIATYFLLRTKLDVKYSILGSLLLLVNPIFFNLTHTFMTDVFALIFMVVSATLFIKFLKNKLYFYFIAAILVAVGGFWIRQYALMTIGGLFFYLLIKDRKLFFKPKILAPIILIPLVSVALWGYMFYFVQDQSYVCPYTLSPVSFAKNVPQLFIYAGYFLFPLGVIFLLGYKKLFSWVRQLGKKALIPVLILVLIIAFIFVRDYVGVNLNPFDKSLAEPRGIGAYTISGDKAFFFPYELWAPIIALSFFTAFGLVTLYLRKLRENLLLILMMAAMAISPLFFTAFYERYYLFLIPLSLPIVLLALKDFRYTKHALIVSVLVLGAWSWYGTYDYLAWNQARWDGINTLLDSGVEERSIDGGLEYDARFFERCTDRSEAVIWHGWAYSVSDEYVISFSQLDGYETVNEVEYFGPFGERLGSIFVEKKSGQPI